MPSVLRRKSCGVNPSGPSGRAACGLFSPRLLKAGLCPPGCRSQAAVRSSPVPSPAPAPDTLPAEEGPADGTLPSALRLGVWGKTGVFLVRLAPHSCSAPAT